MPNAKTIRAIKATRRGELVTVGSTDELFASLNADDRAKLDRRGRRAVRLEDFTDEEMSLIAKAEAPAEDTCLDAELKSRKP